MSDQDVPAPAASAAEFRCPSCGGQMEYDAVRGALVCSSCAATRAVEAGDRSIVEYDLEQGLAQAPRGYGATLRTVQCAQCGAVVSYAEHATATRCDFCGSAQVMERRENRNPIRPESVLPFVVDRAAASQAFSRWIGSLWFRPSDLKQLARVSQMTGLYVPYWAFDARVHSDWHALAGYYYYETEWYTARDAQGRTERRQRSVQRTRWQPAWGNRDDVYDDALVCASKGLPADLAQKLEPFDTARLVRYDPSFLAGWKAEEYSIDLNGGWQLAVARIEATQRARCSRDVPGDTQLGLRVSNRFSDERFSTCWSRSGSRPIATGTNRTNSSSMARPVRSPGGRLTARSRSRCSAWPCSSYCWRSRACASDPREREHPLSDVAEAVGRQRLFEQWERRALDERARARAERAAAAKHEALEQVRVAPRDFVVYGRAIHARHHQVAQYEIVVAAFGQLAQCFAAARSHVHVVERQHALVRS
jgi:hypothetical protein